MQQFAPMTLCGNCACVLFHSCVERFLALPTLHILRIVEGVEMGPGRYESPESVPSGVYLGDLSGHLLRPGNQFGL